MAIAVTETKVDSASIANDENTGDRMQDGDYGMS
jgi:hypothetical protein